MIVTFSNAKSVNEKKLEIFDKVSKQTLFQLLEQCDANTLIPIKNANEIDKLKESLDQIIVTKLRSKFEI